MVVQTEETLRDLLNASAPDSWMELRLAYGSLSRAFDRELDRRRKADAKRDRDAEQTRDEASNHARWYAWNETPHGERVHLILNALADDRLGITDLSDRLEPLLSKARGVEGAQLWPSKIQPTLYKMLQSGDLDRLQMPHGPGGTMRWVYFRKTTLSPDVEALQRALDATEREA